MSQFAMWPETAVESRMLRVILEKGILAPSADNLQPWRFRLRPDAIELYIHRGEGGKFLEVGQQALYVSAGAVIENMRVAAAEFGLRLMATYFPNPSQLQLVAELRFEPNVEKGHRHFASLGLRVTNRKFYDRRRKIHTFLFRELEEMASSCEPTEEPSFSRVRLLWMMNGNDSYPKLSRLIGDADQLRFENQKIHEELVETIRFSREEIERTRDGLDIRTFETGFGGVLLFKLISSWKRLNLLNCLGLSRLFNLYAQFQMASSQAAGLIVTDTHEPADYVHGGEVMEQIWHELTRQGLHIQPMSALPIFILDSILNQSRSFLPSQQKKLDQLKKDFLSLFGISEQNGLILLFRVGYAKPPSARSLRRPLDRFLLEQR